MKSTILLTAILVTILPVCVLANSAPVVSNVTASQRNDDSKLVDIYYDLADTDGDNCTVWAVISDNNGLSWTVPASTFTGSVGYNVSPGIGKHIIWDAGHDCPGKVGTFRARVFADDGRGGDDMVVVPAGYYRPDDGSTWVYVGTFYIDRYEVTNQRYCEFLNAADPNGSYYSPYQGEIYRTGTYGNFSYTVVPGKENCPTQGVCLNDASAFAQWLSSTTGQHYSVPDKYRWQKAAAWDPVQQKFWIYGFQNSTIDCSWCNYNICKGHTTQVGYYNGVNTGTNNAVSYYGCYDMTGNVSELTTEIVGACGYCTRGGNYGSNANSCQVAGWDACFGWNDRFSNGFGFRIVKELP
jgi:hypothetical protein